MKAIFITQHGDSTVLRLRETETPIPSGQEVMVRVTAIGINYADILVREGVYPIGPLPAIAGEDLIWKSNSVTGATIYAASRKQKQQWAMEIFQKIMQGSIRQKTSSFALSAAAEAQDLLKSRSVTGRIVLIP